MPLRELPRLLSGQSSWKRWRFIFVQLAMVAGIIGCTYGEVWLLNMLLDWLRTVVPTTSRLLVLPQARPVMILAASGAFISLAMVIIGGLLSSTLLACIVTPVMVVLLAGKEAPHQQAEGASIAGPA